MTNQFVPPTVKAQSMIYLGVASVLIIVIILLAYNFSPVSNPYIQEVLSLPGNLEQGNAIFQINCAGCHGFQGDGNVGPSLRDVPKRKSKASLIDQVISGKTPPMPKFQPSPQEMADLLSYLEKM